MAMTVIEKILSRAASVSRVVPGDLLTVKVDTAILFDNNFFPSAWRNLRKVRDPDKVIVAFDHRVPAPNQQSAAAHKVGREFVGRFGISRFHDVGGAQGISHVLVAEHGYALPGTVLVCGDSHTCSAGVFNCAARGIGAPEMLYAVATGETWFRLGPTIRYELVGELPHGSTTKDVFLYISGQYGNHANKNIEFGGSGIASLTLNARRTLTTMAAELSAEFATFEPDSLMLDYIRCKSRQDFQPQYADKGAFYEDVRTIDLSAIAPLVAMPHSVIENSCPASALGDRKIDQAFIGSCANGTIDDFEIACRVLAGRTVAPGVRLIVTPGSQSIYLEAVRKGYVETLVAAGAVVTNATCGACGGGHLGVLGPGEVCITASTRNFKGRMGHSDASIYMASPATVAASAVSGFITDPRGYLTR